MPIRSLVPALVVLALALAPAAARANHYDFTVSPNPPNEGQVTTFTLEDPPDDAQIRWDLDEDRDFDDGEGATATHTYTAAGEYTVRVRVNSSGPPHVTTESVTVNGAPSVDFGFTPADPLVGDTVAFSPAVRDPEDDTVTLSWDFGDGGESNEASPTHVYAAAGTYPVTLTATDEHGATAFSVHTVTVAEAQGPPPPPAAGAPGGGAPTLDPVVPQPITPLRMMRPFPVVRIAGVVLPRGAAIRILSVRGPRGARVRVRCRGASCPVRSLTRASAARLVRLRRFERTLRAGTRLEIFVRQRGRIGKYTRFVIRAGEPPARLDRCLVPGRARPVRCT